MRRLGYRWSDWLSDCSTMVCDEVGDACRLGALTPFNRREVLPNGIETSQWKPDREVRQQTRKHLGIGNEFVWLAVGRLDAVKDYQTLLHAIAGLPARGVLLIAGSGPLESRLLQMARTLCINERVRFLGFQTEVCALMQAADAFVLSSRWEGLPLTLLEAGACGLPSVATNVCGSREIIVEDQTGFLVPPADPMGLQRAMATMMELASDDLETMGINARQRIKDRYELTCILDQWESLYARLLSSHPQPRRHGS